MVLGSVSNQADKILPSVLTQNILETTVLGENGEEFSDEGVLEFIPTGHNGRGLQGGYINDDCASLLLFA